jgi:hypothetical protein
MTTKTADPAEDEIGDPMGDEANKRIQAEIDAIRLASHEKTKHMTAEEHTNYFEQLAAPFIKKHGLRTLSPEEKEANGPLS